MTNRFLINGQLKDKEITSALIQAAKDYENGEISETRDLLFDIIHAIDEWEDLQDGK